MNYLDLFRLLKIFRRIIRREMGILPIKLLQSKSDQSDVKFVRQDVFRKTLRDQLKGITNKRCVGHDNEKVAKSGNLIHLSDGMMEELSGKTNGVSDG